MNEPSLATDGGRTPNSTVTDALAKWGAEAGAATAALEEVRLDQNERLLIPFTTDVAVAHTHYLDYPSLRGYVRMRYQVTPLTLPEGADDGAEAIAHFLERFQEGGIDLADVYPRMANGDLACLPEVAMALKMRGITP